MIFFYFAAITLVTCDRLTLPQYAYNLLSMKGDSRSLRNWFAIFYSKSKFHCFQAQVMMWHLPRESLEYIYREIHTLPTVQFQILQLYLGSVRGWFFAENLYYKSDAFIILRRNSAHSNGRHVIGMCGYVWLCHAEMSPWNLALQAVTSYSQNLVSFLLSLRGVFF